MAKVQRANVVLDIKDFEVDYYLSLGYNLISDGGEVIKTALPRDVGTLQHYYTEHIAKIEALEKENEQLKLKLAETEKASKRVAREETAKKVKAEK